MRGALTPHVSFSVLVLPMLVQGVAMSTFFVSMITIQLKDVPPPQTPQASGLSNFARITAGGFAASLTTAFWDRRATLHQSHLADLQASRIPEWQQALTSLQHAGASAKQALGALNAQVVNQASTVAAVDIFWLFGVLSVVMVPLIWFTRSSLSGGAPVSAD
jgi:MFS transporter, DHA2 family, multidrug resistance protein